MTVLWFRESRSRPASPGVGDGGGPDPDVGVQAKRAYDFWDNVGACTHVDRAGTNAYGDIDAVVEGLTRIGLRTVRDGGAEKSIAYVTALNRLISEAGVSVNLGLGKPSKLRPDRWAPAMVTYYLANGLDIAGIRSFESCNEQNLATQNDLPANGYTEAQWAEATRDYMTEVWDTLRNDLSRPPEWRAKPILGYSYGNVDNTTRLIASAGVADWDALCDYGNLHKYFYQNMGAKTDVAITSVRTYHYNAPGKPIVVTETGYHDNMTEPAGGHKPTPEDATAWYIVKSPFEWFRVGAMRVYFYEFLDETPPAGTLQSHFGFYYYKAPTTAGNFVIKPSGLALKNLLSVYADPTGAAYAPGKLDFTVTPAPNLKFDLHQRASDGAFLLALWRDQPLWTWTSSTPPYGTYLTVADVNVTVSLGRVFATVEHRSPSNVAGAGGGSFLVETLNNVSSVVIPVGKTLKVLVIKGGVGPPASLYDTATYDTSVYGS